MDNIGGKIMPFFSIVAATNENTVVTEYEPVKARTDSYQSEKIYGKSIKLS